MFTIKSVCGFLLEHVDLNKQCLQVSGSLVRDGHHGLVRHCYLFCK